MTSGTWRATAIANDKVDDDLTISGGSVDGSPIGSSSPSSGAFTTVTASTSLDVTGSNGIILENDETSHGDNVDLFHDEIIWGVGLKSLQGKRWADVVGC